MQEGELIPHLFRTESGKITAVLCKLFSIQHIEIAEDITSETFLQALETWPYKGIPENPAAWLYAVAKNKAKNHIHRVNVFETKIAAEITPSQTIEYEVDLSDKNISDSQLQMLFALCHPAIPAEAQIGLSLRLLCGFGIDEIANAFLTNKETINKRLFRAKETLRTGKIPIELPSPIEIPKRLETVLTTLYLLFNEGYYSESNDTVVREELCHEAMRLATLLTENPATNMPAVNALLSLMYFHASRFPARKISNGEVILYDEQNESLWDQVLITKGAHYLMRSSVGNSLSKYHLEASIAFWYTVKAGTKEKWENILQLYNRLLQLEYSPIAALNRTYALSKANGKMEAIAEAEKLQLTENQYYFSLLGELYTGIDNVKARQNLERALQLAKGRPDQKTIARKLHDLAIK
jgi:RNA polymerase sigma factor (sigma-70 family)